MLKLFFHAGMLFGSALFFMTTQADGVQRASIFGDVSIPHKIADVLGVAGVFSARADDLNDEYAGIDSVALVAATGLTPLNVTVRPLD